MHKIILIALAAILTAGCAIQPKVYSANSQQYRLKGEIEPITIDARYMFDENLIDKNEQGLFIRINNKIHIAMDTNAQHNGEISCNKDSQDPKHCITYNDKPLAAQCISAPNRIGGYTVTCLFFIDNEKAATFVF